MEQQNENKVRIVEAQVSGLQCAVPSSNRKFASDQDMMATIVRLERQVEVLRCKAQTSEDILGQRKEYEEDIRASVARYESDLAVEQKALRRALKDGEELSALLARHAEGCLPQRVLNIMSVADFSAPEARELEVDVWTAMTARLRRGPHSRDLYGFSARVVKGERIVEHRAELFRTRHPPEHWFAQELRRQVVLMVIEVAHRWRLAAPFRLSPWDGAAGGEPQHGLWWWKHPTRGLMQSDINGVEAAFKLVQSSIVGRYKAHPSFASTDKAGDDYVRDHALALDRVMTGMRPEEAAAEIQAGLAELLAVDEAAADL